MAVLNLHRFVLTCFLSVMFCHLAVVHAFVQKEGGQKEERVWTDATGKVKAKARFVKLDNRGVILAKPNGIAVTLTPDQLSKQDIKYLLENKLIKQSDLGRQEVPRVDPNSPYNPTIISGKGTPFVGLKRMIYGQPYLYPGIVIGSDGEDDLVFLPSLEFGGEAKLQPRQQGNRQSDFSSKTWMVLVKNNDSQSLEDVKAAYRLPKGDYFRIPKSGVSPVVVEEQNVLKEGQEVIIELAITRQGKNPKLQFLRQAGKITKLKFDNHKILIGYDVATNQPFSNFSGIVKSKDGKVIGIIPSQPIGVTYQREHYFPNQGFHVPSKDRKGWQIAVDTPQRLSASQNAPVVVDSVGFLGDESVRKVTNGRVKKVQLATIFLAIDRKRASGQRFFVHKYFAYPVKGFESPESRFRFPRHIPKTVNQSFPIEELDANDQLMLKKQKVVTKGMTVVKVRVPFEIDAALNRMRCSGWIVSEKDLKANPVRSETSHIMPFGMNYVELRLRKPSSPFLLSDTEVGSDLMKPYSTPEGIKVTSEDTKCNFSFPEDPVVVKEVPVERNRSDKSLSDGAMRLWVKAVDRNNRQVNLKVAVSEDEQIAWTLDQGVDLCRFDLKEKKLTKRIRFEPGKKTRFSRSHLLLSSEGLVCTTFNRIILLDPETLKVKKSYRAGSFVGLSGHYKNPYIFGITAHENRPKSLCVIDLSRGRFVHRFSGIFALDGLAKLGEKTQRYNYWEKLNAGQVGCLKVSPDGKYLYVGAAFLAKFRIDGSELSFEQRTLANFRGRVGCSIWISADGQYVSYNRQNIPADKFKKHEKKEVSSVRNSASKNRYVFASNDLTKVFMTVRPTTDRWDSSYFVWLFGYDSEKKQFHTEFKKPASGAKTSSVLVLPKSRKVLFRSRVTSAAGRFDALLLQDLKTSVRKKGVFLPLDSLPKPIIGKWPIVGKSWEENGFRFTTLKKTDNPEAVFEKKEELSAVGVKEQFLLPSGSKFLWINDGKNLILANPNGWIQKVDVSQAAITHKLHLDIPLRTKKEIALGKSFYQSPCRLTATSEGLVVASASAKKLVVIHPSSLKIKKVLDVPAFDEIVGHKEHPFVLCSKQDKREMVLFDVKSGKAVQTLPRHDLPLVVTRKFNLMRYPGRITFFSKDGRHVFDGKNEYELVDGKLVVSGPSPFSNRHMFLNKNGYRISDGSIDRRLGRFGNMRRTMFELANGKLHRLMETNLQKIPQGVHRESGLLFTSDTKTAKIEYSDHDGNLKGTFSKLSGALLFPKGKGKYFLVDRLNPDMPRRIVLVEWLKK